MDPKRILLVEDDEFLRDVYQEVLSAEGFSITVAADGNTALEKVKQGNWDLILMDFYIPQLSGIDIVNQIQHLSPSPAKKIVFLTNVSDEKDLNQMATLGNDYLIKSDLTPQQLVEKVKSYLSN